MCLHSTAWFGRILRVTLAVRTRTPLVRNLKISSSTFVRVKAEGKSMMNEGTLSKTYAFDEHVGRFNVLEFY